MPPLRPTESTWQHFRRGARAGALFGVALLSVAAVRFIFWMMQGHSAQSSSQQLQQLLILAVVYCAAFAFAGAVLASLWPARRTRLGAYALGYLGAAIVSAIVTALVMWIEKERGIGPYALVMSISTLVFGTVAGYQIRHWD